MPYKAVKIKTERIYKAPGTSQETTDGYPAEWFYVGPQAWTLNMADAPDFEDLDAVSIISTLEMLYPEVKFRMAVIL